MKVIEAYKTEKNKAEIGRLLGIPRTTIVSIIKKFEVHGSVENRHRSGRKPKFSVRDEVQLSRIMKSNRRGTLDDITSEINNAKDSTFCSKTVRRKLFKMGYNRWVQKKKMIVRVCNRKKRVLWCRERKNWTVDDHWKNWIFSDECQVVISPFTITAGLLSAHAHKYFRRATFFLLKPLFFRFNHNIRTKWCVLVVLFSAQIGMTRKERRKASIFSDFPKMYESVVPGFGQSTEKTLHRMSIHAYVPSILSLDGTVMTQMMPIMPRPSSLTRKRQLILRERIGYQEEICKRNLKSLKKEQKSRRIGI